MKTSEGSTENTQNLPLAGVISIETLEIVSLGQRVELMQAQNREAEGFLGNVHKQPFADCGLWQFLLADGRGFRRVDRDDKSSSALGAGPYAEECGQRQWLVGAAGVAGCGTDGRHRASAALHGMARAAGGCGQGQ